MDKMAMMICPNKSCKVRMKLKNLPKYIPLCPHNGKHAQNTECIGGEPCPACIPLEEVKQ